MVLVVAAAAVVAVDVVAVVAVVHTMQGRNASITVRRRNTMSRTFEAYDTIEYHTHNNMCMQRKLVTVAIHNTTTYNK